MTVDVNYPLGAFERSDYNFVGNTEMLKVPKFLLVLSQFTVHRDKAVGLHRLRHSKDHLEPRCASVQ